MATTKKNPERRCGGVHANPEDVVLRNEAVLFWHPACGCILYDLEDAVGYEGGRIKREPSALDPRGKLSPRCVAGIHVARRHLTPATDVLWCVMCGALRRDGEWQMVGVPVEQRA